MKWVKAPMHTAAPMKSLGTAISVVVLLSLTLSAQQSNGPLNDQRIADLISMGVSEQEVLRIIAAAPKVDFDLRPGSTDALIKAGVSEQVIKAMAAKESGGSPAPPPDATHNSPNANSVVTHSPSVGGSERFGSVEYLHATTDGKHRREDGQLVVDNSGGRVAFESDRRHEIAIPGNQITRIVYERASKPRYAAGLLIAWPLLFTKSKQHYLTVQYSSQGQGDYAVFRLSKHNYREILAAVESATGRKVDREEER
jgi:hypothetical protein